MKGEGVKGWRGFSSVETCTLSPSGWLWSVNRKRHNLHEESRLRLLSKASRYLCPFPSPFSLSSIHPPPPLFLWSIFSRRRILPRTTFKPYLLYVPREKPCGIIFDGNKSWVSIVCADWNVRSQRNSITIMYLFFFFFYSVHELFPS